MTTALGMPGLRRTGAAVERPTDAGRGLADRFGRTATDLRVSLTDRCNLRCTYCMPAEGLPFLDRKATMSRDEIARLVRIAVTELGVRQVRFTGGEPLLRKDLAEIIADCAALEPRPEISLTTNAIGLELRVAALAAAGLDRINVSLDSVHAETFAQITRRPFLDKVLRGIQASADAGLAVKINAVLLPGVNDHQAPELLEWCLERGHQLRFIEQMPLDADHVWDRERMLTAAQIRERLAERFELRPHDAPRDGAPAELFEAWQGERMRGLVGVIASVTEPFCGDCRRTRLTAEGGVRSCLFSHEETDLLGLLRGDGTDAQIADRWRDAMWAKPAAHGMERPGLGDAGFVQPDRPMSAIGG